MLTFFLKTTVLLAFSMYVYYLLASQLRNLDHALLTEKKDIEEKSWLLP